MNSFKIAWLFPDTLYLHGERGNILALKRFASMAGMTPEVSKIDFSTTDFDPMNFDVIFCPPGEMASFPAVLEFLRPYKGGLDNFVNAGRPLIVTGNSVAIWGGAVRRTDDSSFEGLGIIKCEVFEKENVYGDDNYFKCVYNKKEVEIIGNQIQMADFKNNGDKPLGKIIYGYGNNGKNQEEGFAVKNSIFTNTLGPMLITNPKLSIEIINVVLENKAMKPVDFDFDDNLEAASFKTKKEFIMTKESKLTNV